MGGKEGGEGVMEVMGIGGRSGMEEWGKGKMKEWGKEVLEIWENGKGKMEEWRGRYNRGRGKNGVTGKRGRMEVGETLEG